MRLAALAVFSVCMCAQTPLQSILQRLQPHLPEELRAVSVAFTGEERYSPHRPYLFPRRGLLVPSSVVLQAEDESTLAAMMAHALLHSQSKRPSPAPGVVLGVGCADLSAPFRHPSLTAAAEQAIDEMVARLLHAAGYDPLAVLRTPRAFETERRDHLRPVLDSLAPTAAQIDSSAYRAWRQSLLPAPRTARRTPPTLLGKSR